MGIEGRYQAGDQDWRDDWQEEEQRVHAKRRAQWSLDDANWWYDEDYRPNGRQPNSVTAFQRLDSSSACLRVCVIVVDLETSTGDRSLTTSVVVHLSTHSTVRNSIVRHRLLVFFRAQLSPMTLGLGLRPVDCVKRERRERNCRSALRDVGE